MQGAGRTGLDRARGLARLTPPGSSRREVSRWAAAVVIPLVAIAIPIVLILLAVLFDALFLGWFLFRMWHDEWAERVGNAILNPIRAFMHSKQPAPRVR